MNNIQAIIIAIVEGITEFLPISSTAHMIFTSTFFGIEENAFVKIYQIAIQFGAILSVVVLYPKRFFRKDFIQFYSKLLIGVAPAMILGFFFGDFVEKALEKPIIVALVMVIGGIFLLFADQIFSKPFIVGSDQQLNFKNVFWVGCWQCLALMPGVSRSAASIVGGLHQKFSKNLAAEFSFFLAVPTMLAASVYALFIKKWEHGNQQITGYALIISSKDHQFHFFLGNVVAFVVAMIAIKTFIKLLKKYGLKIWGWYRIVTGFSLLILFFLN